MDLVQQLKAQALALGFSKVGVALADALGEEAPWLTQWLRAGQHAQMAWMNDPRRQHIQQVLPGVRSVVVVALNYKHSAPSEPPDTAHLSAYTRGRDYHKVLGSRLKQLVRWLTEVAPGHRHRWYVDTGPVSEKVWAAQAGLGWIGKNSLLLTREYGSWVFLGVLLTTLELPPDRSATAHCGTCQRCLVACPTGAILPNAVVDSNRCIAYHTLENPDPELPAGLDLAGWVVGCDLCQTCCPFNTKGPLTELADLQPRPGTSGVPLSTFATMTDEAFDLWSRGMALRRVKAPRLRRNAQHQIRYTQRTVHA
ncbi:tRNA epoxyqueuosine(34) reductase QueG [Anthocerotibacter panamensis]|uniref:tRNA epoxyqueuosine(34) reductase QueG n=1 Tax=Anthocerotibacter panamensis TaxID=2857077 RepID=UPI001C406597|nr:tRNA epoxyqueuosine(34) reductase QueG [Anthocerotibacter panamensis]